MIAQSSLPFLLLLFLPPPPPPPLVKHNRLRLCLYIVFLAPYLLPPQPPLSFVCPPSLPSSQQFDCSTCEQQKTCAPSNQCVLTPSSSSQQQQQQFSGNSCLLQSLSPLLHFATNRLNSSSATRTHTHIRRLCLITVDDKRSLRLSGRRRQHSTDTATRRRQTHPFLFSLFPFYLVKLE